MQMRNIVKKKAYVRKDQQALNWHFLTNQNNNRVLKWWRHKNEISEIMAFVRIFWKNNVQEAYLLNMTETICPEMLVFLDVVLSEYPDKSLNFRNFIFMTSSLKYSIAELHS